MDYPKPRIVWVHKGKGMHGSSKNSSRCAPTCKMQVLHRCKKDLSVRASLPHSMHFDPAAFQQGFEFAALSLFGTKDLLTYIHRVSGECVCWNQTMSSIF